jgi:hypothetical protein
MFASVADDTTRALSPLSSAPMMRSQSPISEPCGIVIVQLKVPLVAVPELGVVELHRRVLVPSPLGEMAWTLN